MTIKLSIKRNNLILMVIAIVFGLTLFGCKKQEQETLTPKITDDKVETTATTATFTWTVDWPGKLISVVEVSENEDMSHSQIYGSETETENHDFTVTVTGLEVATKYYFRFWVWNRYYEDNKFVMEGGDFATVETGVLNGVFSVNQSKKVRFSKGNLQYQASTNIWRFAKNQWDYVGEANENISQIYSGWIDLFGWGTSGWNSGAVCYQPWSTSTTDSDYYPGGSYTNNLTGGYANADWGVHNAIYNGGNQAGQWRTLTKDEWVYVFQDRNNASSKYGHGKVNGVCGMILLPDSWTLPSGLSFTAGNSSWANSYTADQWAQMEANGAVFLPAAGCRYGTSVSNVGSYGGYWSASYYSSNYAYFLYFDGGSLYPSDYNYRGYGRSVRLVAPAE